MGSALSYHNDRMAFSALIGVMDNLSNLLRRRFDFRDHDTFRATCDPCHQRQIAAVPPHHLNHKGSLVTGSRVRNRVYRLDNAMQRRIRTFIREYNQRYEATMLLTSHYMADVEALCQRLLIIHSGKLLFDGDTAALVQRFAPQQTIEDAIAEMFAGGAV